MCVRVCLCLRNSIAIRIQPGGKVAFYALASSTDNCVSTTMKVSYGAWSAARPTLDERVVAPEASR